MQKFEDLIDIFADTLLFPLVFKNNFDIFFCFFFFFLIILFTKWQYRKIDWNDVFYFFYECFKLNTHSFLFKFMKKGGKILVAIEMGKEVFEDV
jgi:hypothetical protein